MDLSKSNDQLAARADQMILELEKDFDRADSMIVLEMALAKIIVAKVKDHVHSGPELCDEVQVTGVDLVTSSIAMLVDIFRNNIAFRRAQ